MSDLIDRNEAIDMIEKYFDGLPIAVHHDMLAMIHRLPSVQPDIIRCKDCRWWDKYDDWGNGYCMAAKHGYWSEHWEIIIRRTYKGDFYCADAEPKGEFDDEVEEEDEGEQDG